MMLFDEFEDILNSMHNFISFRYLSAKDKDVPAHGGLLSSLNEAVFRVISPNSHCLFTQDIR